jgi:hypothetical protein
MLLRNTLDASAARRVRTAQLGTYRGSEYSPNSGRQQHRIGYIARSRFYLGSTYCAYDLPGGTIAMHFTGNTLVAVPDGQGAFTVGTIDINIIEATGVYQSFVGGHNKMVGGQSRRWRRTTWGRQCSFTVPPQPANSGR